MSECGALRGMVVVMAAEPAADGGGGTVEFLDIWVSKD